MGKARQKAMKRNGTKRRWSDKSALPVGLHSNVGRLGNSVDAASHEYMVKRRDNLRREEEEQNKLRARFDNKLSKALSLQDLTGYTFRKLAHMSMNPASMAEPLPKDSHAYPRETVKLKRVEIRQEKQIEYRVLWLSNGEGYKEAMVFGSDGPGFWYCLYDVDTGSYVSNFRFTDKKLFQFEREHGLLQAHLRLVTYKEPQFVIADRRV